MHRIDTPTAKNGTFTDGNPHKPKEEYPTQLNASWFNGVQEELCSFIEGQGISLNKNERNQLEQAVNTKLEPYRIAINKIIAVIKAEVASGAEIDEIG